MAVGETRNALTMSKIMDDAQVAQRGVDDPPLQNCQVDLACDVGQSKNCEINFN